MTGSLSGSNHLVEHLPAADRAAADAVNAATLSPPEPRELWPALADALVAHADRTAVVAGGESVTYAELADRVDARTDDLTAAGLADSLVGVSLPKGIDYVAAVLSVLNCGGAFLPIPERWPEARRETVTASARPAGVIDSDGLRSLPDPSPIPVGDRAAYVLYTSGSTGTPKGVTISSAGAMCTVDASVAEYGVGPGDRVLGLSSLAFDLSVWDVLATLTSGATLVLPSDDDTEGSGGQDPDLLLALMREHRITVTMGAPALIDLIVLAAESESGGESGPARALPEWRLVLTGGDWIPLRLPGRARAVGSESMTFVSIGGATECSLFSIVYAVDDVDPEWSSIPYGRAVAGHTAYVLDDDLLACRTGAIGDIWIGGRGVGLGYWRDAERSDAAFRTHPSTGERMYATGDRGRYRADGNIELLGRADRQIQLRGYRIELGEVEAALVGAPGVQAGAVTTRAAVADGSGPAAVTAVVAHVVAPDVSAEQILAHLASVLPDYEVPAAVIHHDAFPLTANGKWDRDALAAVADPTPADASDAVPFTDSLTAAVADIWAAETGAAGITVDSDFFACGGDSLSAVRVIYRVRSELRRAVAMTSLQDAPTLGGFVASLRGAEPEQTVDTSDTQLTADPARRFDPFPLTDQQQAYVLGRGDDFVSGRVACHVYVEYRVPDDAVVDVDRLNRAWRRVIERHDALRIVIDPDTMTQRVLDRVPEFALETVTGDDDAAAVRDRLSHEVRDPATWPLFAVAAQVNGPAGRVRRLMLSVDALISDFRGLRVMLDDLGTFYRGDEPAPLDIGFRDYVLAVRALDEGPAGTAGAAHWADRVGALPDGPRLPMIARPDDLDTPVFVARHDRLDAPQWRGVTEAARGWGVTATAVLIGCYAATLARWAETPHFTLNIPNFNRLPLHPHVDDLIGEFATFILLDVDVDPATDFADFCRGIQRTLWAHMDAGRRSGVGVLRDVAAARGGLASPLAPVVLTSEIAVAGGDHETFLDGALVEDYAVTQTPQVWMDMRIEERAGRLRINWDVLDDLFPAGMPDEMFADFVGTLRHIANGGTVDADSAGVPSAAPLCGPEPGPPGLAHTRFIETVRADPHACAVIDGEREWTRGDVAAAAARVTDELIRRGVGRGDLVGVVLDRGAPQFAAVYGILAAGAAYVPVDPDYPAQRIAAVLAAANPAAVLHDARSAASAEGFAAIAIEDVAATSPADLRAWLAAAARAAEPSDLAYVLFTSGSTGRPKGVMVRHDSVAVCIDATVDRFGLDERSRSLAVSALHHDMSVFDFFVVPAAGGIVVTIDQELRRDSEHWARRCAMHGAGHVCAVPAMVTMLCDGIDFVRNDGDSADDLVDLVLTGGDRVSPQLIARLRGQSPRATVASIGGPTETTAWNIWHVVEAGQPIPDPVPYGAPIAGNTYRVIDSFGRTRPRWAVGEMEVTGAGVANGYLGDRERTRAVFSERDGQRVFRTGDRGYVDASGEIVFVGRADDQVKIRGNRIEPGEVEAAMRGVAGVSDAAVVVVTGSDGAPSGLIGHVAGAVSADAVLAHLRDTVPGPAVPSHVMVTEALPLSPNGKVDRSRLPLPAAVRPTSADSDGDGLPQTSLEEMLCLIWGRELGVDEVGRHDNFFSLGGNSLLASRIIMRLREVFADTGISLRVVINTKDVTAMAGALLAAEPRPGELEQIAAIYLEVEAMAADEVDSVLG